MPKKDLSIEYSHIYTNQHISEVQQLSIKILEQVRSEAYTSGESSSLVVMVDDYSFPNPSFDYDELFTWLSKEGHAPDVFFRESQLMPMCDQVLELISDRDFREELVTYVKTRRYPCSLFIAAWYFLRLGVLESPLYPKEFQAERLINILPYDSKQYEDKGLEIMLATPYKDLVERISYRFTHGHLFGKIESEE